MFEDLERVLGQENVFANDESMRGKMISAEPKEHST